MLVHLLPVDAQSARRNRRQAVTRAALRFLAVTASLYAVWALGRAVWGGASWRATANWYLARLVTVVFVAPAWAWLMWHAGYVRARPAPASSNSPAL